MDNRKLIVSFFLAGGAILWFLSRSAIHYFYLSFYQVRRLPGIGFLSEAAPVILGGALFLIVLNNSKVNTLLEECVAELKKVTWPTRDEVVRSTTVVIICIVIASFILAGFDVLFGKVVGYFLKG